MYQVGQQVVYGIHGICLILDVEVKTIDRQKVEYFVLEPVNQPGTRYYIPVNNPATMAKLSPLLSKNELDQLFENLHSYDEVWITDENHRKLMYRTLINSTDRAKLISMVRALHIHKQMQADLGKKFHQCDENFLRDAEKLLNAEVSAVLQVSSKEATQYILDHINEKPQE